MTSSRSSWIRSSGDESACVRAFDAAFDAAPGGDSDGALVGSRAEGAGVSLKAQPPTATRVMCWEPRSGSAPGCLHGSCQPTAAWALFQRLPLRSRRVLGLFRERAHVGSRREADRLHGELESMARSDAQAKALGAIVGRAVSAETDLLVAGPGAGSKLKAALKHGTRLLNEAEWITLSGGGRAGAKKVAASKKVAKKAKKATAKRR